MRRKLYVDDCMEPLMTCHSNVRTKTNRLKRKVETRTSRSQKKFIEDSPQVKEKLCPWYTHIVPGCVEKKYGMWRVDSLHNTFSRFPTIIPSSCLNTLIWYVLNYTSPSILSFIFTTPSVPTHKSYITADIHSYCPLSFMFTDIRASIFSAFPIVMPAKIWRAETHKEH